MRSQLTNIRLLLVNLILKNPTELKIESPVEEERMKTGALQYKYTSEESPMLTLPRPVNVTERLLLAIH